MNLNDYARVAGEALLASSREADVRKATLLRRQAYSFVDMMREEEGGGASIVADEITRRKG